MENSGVITLKNTEISDTDFLHDKKLVIREETGKVLSGRRKGPARPQSYYEGAGP